jgi:lysozyme
LGVIGRIALVVACLVLLAAVALELYRTGHIQLNRPDPEIFSVRGIDVSHHQGVIDWAEVRASGIDFAFIKSSEGRDFIDTRFETNWRESREVGIAGGAYHFFTFCSPGADQAAHFLATAPPQANALTPVADVEFPGNCTTWSSIEKIRAELEIFLQLVGHAWGRLPILYVTQSSYERIVRGHLDPYPVWIRDVFWEPDAKAYGGWWVWQYSHTGRIQGIQGPVDLDVLRPDVRLRDLKRVSP